MKEYAIMESIPLLALVLRAITEKIAQKVCYNLDIVLYELLELNKNLFSEII